ncbi:MAG: hypothetical protein RLZZ367_879 [Bacteroidota bacterium]|jgi:REP element-mobilizing transposase RayT
MPHQLLYEDEFYHLYNRGNNGENLFYNHENYIYFLKKYDFYLSDYIDTYAYCLLPNHFHLLIRVKQFDSFPKEDSKLAYEYRCSEQFRRFFMSYAKAINKQQERTGSLFENAFKRKQVNSEVYMSRLICYIHTNPRKHGITDDFQNYLYSSYNRILDERISKLKKKEVIEWFGGKESFSKTHSESQIDLINDDWVIEDE